MSNAPLSTERIVELRRILVTCDGQGKAAKEVALALLLDELASASSSELYKTNQMLVEQFSYVSAALESARRERDERSDLVRHMWVHDGYSENGYWEMTPEQKALYSAITGRYPDVP